MRPHRRCRGRPRGGADDERALAGDGPLSVLAVGARPDDDIEIGSGATLLQALIDPGGSTLRGMVIHGSDGARVQEASGALHRVLPRGRSRDALLSRRPAAGPLGRRQGRPAEPATRLADLVLCPRADDAHQDRLLGRLVPTVWRDALVLHYEIPRSGTPTSSRAHPLRAGVGLTWRGARWLCSTAHYPSQRDRDWWGDELFLGLMRLRGVDCKRPVRRGLLRPQGRPRPRVRSGVGVQRIAGHAGAAPGTMAVWYQRVGGDRGHGLHRVRSRRNAA